MKHRKNFSKSEWRLQHPASLEVGILNKAVDLPEFAKRPLRSLVDSPNDRYSRKGNARLREDVTKKETKEIDRRRAAISNPQSNTEITSQQEQGDSSGAHGPDGEANIGAQNSPNHGNNSEITFPPPVNPVAAFVLEAVDPKNWTGYARIHVPCHPKLDVDVNVETTLDGAHKQATLDFIGHPERLQELRTPEVLLAALRVIHFPAALTTCTITPYFSMSTTGHKQLGLRTGCAREVKPPVDSSDAEHINNNHSSNIINNESNNNITNLNSNNGSNLAEVSPQSIAKQNSSNASEFNKSSPPSPLVANEKVNSMPLVLKEACLQQVTQSLSQARSSVFYEKQVAYFVLGLFFIGIRVSALRKRKSARNKTINMEDKIFVEKTKIITFVIDQSTDFSTLAISLFCYPCVGHLKKAGFNLFLLFLKWLNEFLPQNFFSTLFCFLESVPLLDALGDMIVIFLTYTLCRFFRIVLINIIEGFVNFLVEQVCFLFFLVSSNMRKLTAQNA